MTEQLIDNAVREANIDTTRLGNQASGVTGVYGLSGAGKTNLITTAAEWLYQHHQMVTLLYAADLGGFGNRMLTLIRAGIVRAYDPRNHVNPFETMELISLGAFPERLIDPERGHADPEVKLILPRRARHGVKCPAGHIVGYVDHAMEIAKFYQACPLCGTMTTAQNMAGLDKQIVEHPMFAQVGGRAYDSFTALNEWGMSDLQAQSAAGLLPTGGQGGSALGSADALRSGGIVFGTSSKAQFGFLQNRTYGWLANIRTIPNQKVPAIATFGVEQSKGDDETGGVPVLGPKISGNAATGKLGFWLGNLLHAAVEPNSPSDPKLVYRLWLTQHVDPNDPRKLLYQAKHRGTPAGMPQYLQDGPNDPPWTKFSLGYFYDLLQAQLETLDAEVRTKYPNAPGVWLGDGVAGPEVVVESHAVSAAAPVAAPTAAQAATSPAAMAAAQQAMAGPVPPVVSAPRRRPIAGGGPVPPVVAAPVAPVVPAVTAQPIVVPQPGSATPAPQQAVSPAAAATPPVTAPPVPSTPSVGTPRIRRVARPPV
jgi:hypothetical protein